MFAVEAPGYPGLHQDSRCGPYSREKSQKSAWYPFLATATQLLRKGAFFGHQKSKITILLRIGLESTEQSRQLSVILCEQALASGVRAQQTYWRKRSCCLLGGWSALVAHSTMPFSVLARLVMVASVILGSTVDGPPLAYTPAQHTTRLNHGVFRVKQESISATQQ